MMTGLSFSSHCPTVSLFLSDQLSKFHSNLGTFKHWKTSGNAIFLKNKVILSPELSDSTGLLYAKNVSVLDK
jgi:hypothetical protein